MTNYMQDYFQDCLKDFSKPNGWENLSYNNDSCPSFGYKGYQIFIDHPDSKERELGEDSTRFHVIVALDYGNAQWSFDTNDFEEVLKEIEIPYQTRPLAYDLDYYIREHEMYLLNIHNLVKG